MTEHRPTWRPRKAKASQIDVADALDNAAPRAPEPWPTQAHRIQAAVAYAMSATDEIVATLLGKSKETIQRHFVEEKAVAKQLLKMKLAGRLYSRAIVDGDTASLIFLAKNELGMTDRRDLTSGGEIMNQPTNGQPVLVRVEYVVTSDPRALAAPPAHLLEATASPVDED